MEVTTGVAAVIEAKNLKVPDLELRHSHPYGYYSDPLRWDCGEYGHFARESSRANADCCGESDSSQKVSISNSSTQDLEESQ